MSSAVKIRGGVQRRFYTLVDAAAFDEERARAWVIVRVIRRPPASWLTRTADQVRRACQGRAGLRPMY